jgi:hypothetical protein
MDEPQPMGTAITNALNVSIVLEIAIVSIHCRHDLPAIDLHSHDDGRVEDYSIRIIRKNPSGIWSQLLGENDVVWPVSPL